jgi:hypothetical protein
MRLRPSLPFLLSAAGLALAALAALEPTRLTPRVVGPLLAGAALVLTRRSRRPLLPATLAVALSLAYAVTPLVEPEFRADSLGYVAYLRSALIDHDLEFANEWRHFGLEPSPRTATGYTTNIWSVGPALFWSPFYLVAHAWVVGAGALGLTRQSADGYAVAYLHAIALATQTAVALGAATLFIVLRRRHGPGHAALAAALTVGATPLLYYAFVVPTMAHGLAFGLAAGVVWAWDGAFRAPSLRAWLVLGVLFGAMTLVRWQALVLALLLAPLVLAGLARRQVRPGWVVAGAGAALLAFSPQLVAWKRLFGAWITQPAGAGYVDWSSPRGLETLVSANHGLVSWTPLALAGLVGLVVGLRREPLLHTGALASLAALAWVNGGVFDWAGADAFGARRYDVGFALLALGVAEASARLARAVAHRPLLAPAAVGALLVLWNLGLVALFRAGRYPDAAPFEQLAADQARLARRGAQSVLGALFGPRGAAFAYDVLSAEYLYEGRFNPAGSFNLARLGDEQLSGAWSPPQRRADGPAFRWVNGREACLRVPLREPFDYRASILARAPRRVAPQTLRVTMNGTPVGAVTLDASWREHAVLVPAAAQVPGENFLCLGFARLAHGEGGTAVAAAVSRVQLP